MYRNNGCMNRGYNVTEYGYSKPVPKARPAPPVGKENFCICASQPISLAMSYIKDQPFEDLYQPEEALCKGTLFSGLYMPYGMGNGGR